MARPARDDPGATGPRRPTPGGRCVGVRRTPAPRRLARTAPPPSRPGARRALATAGVAARSIPRHSGFIADSPDALLFFAYGTLLQGEPEHALLGSAKLIGPSATAPAYTLVDLGPYPALLAGGAVAVVGELYRISRKLRFELDVKHQVPVLFHRVEVALADGTRAETYAMKDEQVRGKRRLASGDWRGRFAPKPRSMPLPTVVRAARGRFPPR